MKLGQSQDIIEDSCFDISLFSRDELFLNALKEEANSRGLSLHLESDPIKYQNFIKDPYFQPKILLTPKLEQIQDFKEFHPNTDCMLGLVLHRKDMQARLRLIEAGVELFVDTDMSPYHIIEVCHLELSSRELKNFTILLYEAHYPFGKEVQKSLEEMMMDCKLARSPQDLSILTQKLSPKLIVLDLTQESQESGEKVLNLLLESPHHDIPSVVCIGAEQEELLEQAYTLGIEDFIIRPIGLRVFVARLANIAQKVALMNVVKDFDPLTRLLSRSAFKRSFQQEIAKIYRRKTPTCLAIIDLDFFKDVNDDYGHKVGDQVLKSFAQFLSQFIRKDDLVGRWGGEEFVVLLKDCTLEEAQFLFNRCLELCQGMRFIEQAKQQRLTFSCGLVPFPKKNICLEDLFHSADTLLYQAKRQGRNCVITPACLQTHSISY